MSSLVQQIAEAQLARIQGIAGFGNAGLRPRSAAGQIDTYPAAFLSHAKLPKEPHQMGSTGGTKLVKAEFTWFVYARDVDGFFGLCDATKAVADALESPVYNLEIEGLSRLFEANTEVYNPAPPDSLIGFAIVAVTVQYIQPYGAA